MEPVNNEPGQDKSSWKISPSQWKLFFVILVLGCAGMAYAYLRHSGFRDSALLYVGIPLLLALGLSLTPKAKSAKSATMKGITIALLLSGPVFREGYICILFASPIFYFIGGLAAWAVDAAKKKRNGKSTLQAALVSTVLAVMALEGTTEMTSFPREHEITATKTIPASLKEVRHALANTPSMDGDKPLFLRIFPYPVLMSGSGLQVGDERRAKFVAYKHIFWNRVEGDAVFKVKEATDRKIVFTLESDTSYVGHYVDWKTSEVEMAPAENGYTQVTWKLSFHRKYDPYWYFGTLQEYAVRLVAEELIDHAATPRS